MPPGETRREIIREIRRQDSLRLLTVVRRDPAALLRQVARARRTQHRTTTSRLHAIGPREYVAMAVIAAGPNLGGRFGPAACRITRLSNAVRRDHGSEGSAPVAGSNPHHGPVGGVDDAAHTGQRVA